MKIHINNDNSNLLSNVVVNDKKRIEGSLDQTMVCSISSIRVNVLGVVCREYNFRCLVDKYKNKHEG